MIFDYNRIADLTPRGRKIFAVVVEPAGCTTIQIHGLIRSSLLHHFCQLWDGGSTSGQQNELMVAC